MCNNYDEHIFDYKNKQYKITYYLGFKEIKRLKCIKYMKNITDVKRNRKISTSELFAGGLNPLNISTVFNLY